MSDQISIQSIELFITQRKTTTKKNSIFSYLNYLHEEKNNWYQVYNLHEAQTHVEESKMVTTKIKDIFENITLKQKANQFDKAINWVWSLEIGVEFKNQSESDL